VGYGPRLTSLITTHNVVCHVCSPMHPGLTTRGCALVKVTPPPICVVLVVPTTTFNLQANQRTSKNKWTSKQHTDLAQMINLTHEDGILNQANGWSN
jgi:hypothetical protein